MGDLTQLRREFRELASDSAAEEEQAKYELTASARHFSRRAKHVVDDKLSFSATLMRAGEVDAANRLLEEVHEDVRTEEAALIETMNEVKVARAATRERMTRVRLARMVAVSLVGSMLMGFSALGMAAAGFVENRERDQVRQNAAAQRRALKGRSHEERRVAAKKLDGLDRRVRRLLMAADLPVTDLTAADLRRIDLLTDGTVDVGALEEFLVRVLPSPDLARQVASQIAGHVDRVVTASKGIAEEKAPTVTTPRVKKKVQKSTEQAAAEDEAAEEPGPSPSPSDSPSPPEEETKEGGKKQETGGGDGGDGGSGGGHLPGDGDDFLDGV